MRYLPYGEERWSNGESVTDFGFTSQRQEKGFGLYDYNARYYSPTLGRFISPDSIIPDPTNGRGFNRYRYVKNNPLKYADPSGHCVWDLCITETTFLVLAAGAALYMTYEIVTSDAYQQTLSDTEQAIEDLIKPNASTAPQTAPPPGYGEGELEFNDPFQLPGTNLDVPGWNPNLPGASTETQPGTDTPGFALDPDVPQLTVTQMKRFDGPKPGYAINPAHVSGRGLRPGKTPLPADAEDVYRNAVPNDPVNPTAWFGRNADGQIYRYSPSNDGTAHFSGIDGVGDGIRNLTKYALERLDQLDN